MKKNIVFLFIVIFASSNLFSQEINYRALENCQSVPVFFDLYADNSIISDLDGYEEYKKDFLMKIILLQLLDIYRLDMNFIMKALIFEALGIYRSM